MNSFLVAGLNNARVSERSVNLTKFIEFVNTFSSDRRYKCKIKAADCYCGGSHSGIFSYKKLDYYFNVEPDQIVLEYK